ncbi:MAG: nitrile hydratase subunit beta [Alphaproteobacteria bacterium]|nr:nitrile hydratase subunit beta [Alphaproteobacteria bacterium]
MNSIHDMGGMHGFGPIVRDQDERNFHERWEERVFGLFFGGFALGEFNVDMLRHAIENMPAHEYLSTAYYEHWLHAMEALFIANGTLTRAQIDQRIAELKAELDQPETERTN